MLGTPRQLYRAQDPVRFTNTRLGRAMMLNLSDDLASELI